MKYIKLLLVPVSLLVLLPACKKHTDIDKRDNFVGTYYLTGNYIFVDSTAGFYYKTSGLDTASFTITKPASPDSIWWVYFQGLGSVDGHVVKFLANGVLMPAAFTDTLLTIPRQHPWSSSDLTVHVTCSFVKGKLTLQYQSYYGEYTKTATVSQP